MRCRSTTGQHSRRAALYLRALCLLAIPLLLSLASCDKKATEVPGTATPETKKIGLVVGFGGLGDRAFNDTHYNGMIQASQRYGLSFEYRVPTDEQDFVSPAEELIAAGCELIVAGAGFFMIDAVDQLAQKHPQVFFILNDTQAKHYYPNVASLTYRQNEGSFLAGALSAMVSKTGTIAALGAADVPVINDFLLGFAAGARLVRTDSTVLTDYIQPHLVPAGFGEAHAWNAPRTANKVALELYGKGAEIIFQVAGGSGLGVFLAAESSGKLAVGVDSDQDYLVPGHILTSMMKNVDQGILLALGLYLEGRLENRNYSLGVREGGVGLSPMSQSSQHVNTEILARLEALKRDLLEGRISVPTAFATAAGN